MVKWDNLCFLLSNECNEFIRMVIKDYGKNNSSLILNQIQEWEEKIEEKQKAYETSNRVWMEQILSQIEELKKNDKDAELKRQSVEYQKVVAENNELKKLRENYERILSEEARWKEQYFICKQEKDRMAQEIKELKEQLIQFLKEIPAKPETCVNENPFFLETKNVSVQDIEQFLNSIGNTEAIDRLFEEEEEITEKDKIYKKIFEKYKKKINRYMDKFDEEEEIEEHISAVLSILHSELLKKVMVAIYRGSKNGNTKFELKFLKTVNQYLSNIGFYTRNNIFVGDILKEEDYDDMEFIVDNITEGRHKEITEIELYPYYLNYKDEDGEVRKVHTQGMMIIIA